jgi:peroxiredoxin
VLGFNRADDNEIALEFLRENGATVPTVLDTSKAAWEVCGKFETMGGRSGVPLTYIIDREGKVAGAWYGFDGNHSRGKEVLRRLGIE